MTAMSRGEAAHSRWFGLRWPDMTDKQREYEWTIASERAKAAWEAAGTPPELEELRRMVEQYEDAFQRLTTGAAQ